jgi:hypothetical protein
MIEEDYKMAIKYRKFRLFNKWREVIIKIKKIN